MAKNPGYPQVEVVWEDAESDCSWQTGPEAVEADKARMCRTRGYLITENKKRIVVAHTVSRGENEVHYNGHIVIPRGMVRKMTVSKKLYG